MIGEDRAPLPHRFGSHGTLIGTQADADEAIRKFSIRLLANQLVGEIAPPEINAGHLEELASGFAEQLNQGTAVGSFTGFGRNSEQKFLEALIGARYKTIFRGDDGTAARNA